MLGAVPTSVGCSPNKSVGTAPTNVGCSPNIEVWKPAWILAFKLSKKRIKKTEESDPQRVLQGFAWRLPGAIETPIFEGSAFHVRQGILASQKYKLNDLY